jgi:import inner membrane translocase subunit TIM8
MPFWNRGGDSDPAPPAEQSFSDSSSGFETGGNDMSMSGGAAGLGVGGNEMQQFALQMRQQMMVQTVINNLTDKAFEKCITSRPGDSLGGKEAACVHATVNKWLDTNEFMMGRLQKKQEAQAGQQTFA